MARRTKEQQLELDVETSRARFQNLLKELETLEARVIAKQGQIHKQAAVHKENLVKREAYLRAAYKEKAND